MERQLTFAGILAESEAREQIVADRRERLEQAMRIAGLRPGTVAWNLAELIHKVAGTSDGVLRRKNELIAQDYDMRKRNGRRPKVASIKTAAAQLRDLGLIEQKMEPMPDGSKVAARSINHAAVMRVCEAGSIEVLTTKIAPEIAGDFTRDFGGDSRGDFRGEKTARLYISIRSIDPKEPSSSSEGQPIREDEEDSLVDESEATEANTTADDELNDLIELFDAAYSPSETLALRQALRLTQHGPIDPETFLAYVGDVLDRAKRAPPDNRLVRPGAYLLRSLQREVDSMERSKPCSRHC